MDMSGNAAEWVADWYDPAAYARLPERNPLGDGPMWSHSVRGSPWLVYAHAAAEVAEVSRCSYRNASHAIGDPRLGFRCATGS
jgi:formylglycine-generating enzyme required for sulfatase activity